MPSDSSGYTAVLVFDDPTPNALIQNRIVRPATDVLPFTDVTNEEGQDWLDLVILIARKMRSVWKHLEAYRSDEARLAAKFAEDSISHREFSQDLYEEFDVFAVQIKSTLDHLVKVLRPVLGRKWTMYTFADKGQGVLTSLQRNTSRHYKHHVKMMEILLFQEKQTDWLTKIIEIRDRVNHGQMGGLKIETFAVYRRSDGVVSLPTWNSEQTLNEAMAVIWDNFFHYVEDFLALAINFRVRQQEFALVRKQTALSSMTPSWKIFPREAVDKLKDAPGFERLG